ncbi:hypothetical protein COV20_04140 [Candidatus Woesearchaeota archaeon CG10_big_fil_rev_8_21_14_0_10_45_16]|nr:MAG: hypothetical protein COV20_04140 [Candidatus Woesearchaeota archaeon CG10_big_fil_rev_8_21_14_0_10_45_16]
MVAITFLGTAGTSAVVSKQFRSSGGIVLQQGDFQLHLDPGPGSLNRAKEFGINVHHTTAILVSNNTLLSCNDLNVMIDAMTHGGIEQRGLVLGSKTVLQGAGEIPSYLTPYHRKLVERIIPFDKSHKLGLDSVEISALPAKHADANATGFKIQFPRVTVSYTGDTALSEELLENLGGSDVIVLSVPFPGNKGQGSHLDTETAIKIISRTQPKLVIISNFGMEMLKADPIQEAREIQRITGIQTIAAYDGLKVASDGFGMHQSPVKGF